MDRILEKKHWTPNRVAILAFAGVLLSLVVFSLMASFSKSSLVVSAEGLIIEEVTRGPFYQDAVVRGTLQPLHFVNLAAVEGGRVESVAIQQGSYVEKGQEIVRLSNTDLELEIARRDEEHQEALDHLQNTMLTVEQSRRNFKEKMIELDFEISLQKDIFEREKILHKEGLTPEQKYKEAEDRYHYLNQKKNALIESSAKDEEIRKAQIAQAEDAVRRKGQNLETARRKIERLTLHAPMSGVLTSLDAEAGQTKRPGDHLGQIDSLESGFEIRAEVDETYSSKVAVGQIGEFTHTDRQTYQARVKQVHREVRNGRFRVDLEFVGEMPDDLKRGQTFTLKLALEPESEKLRLPIGDFFQKTGGRWIFVVDPSGDSASRREIQIGAENTQYYEVLSGLSPGERVITSPYNRIVDFDRLILED